MTALTVLELCDPDETVTIPAEATGIEGTSIYLTAGEELTVRDLLYGLLLSSGNDAAVALALHAGGSVSAFVAEMNERAEALGLTQTHFENPNGLDGERHYSTARDMANLTAKALKNPIFSEIVATKTYTAGKRCFQNHNRLLWTFNGAIGVKTGYTERAGRCLVSAVKYKGNTLICVTLSDPDDWVDHRRLLDACKKQYTTYKLERHVQVPVVGGMESYVTAEFRYSQTALNATYTVRLYYYPFIYAPVKKGDVIGYACINQITVPMRAQEDIEIYATEE